MALCLAMQWEYGYAALGVRDKRLQANNSNSACFELFSFPPKLIMNI